jgi:hypothetical protein
MAVALMEHLAGLICPTLLTQNTSLATPAKDMVMEDIEVDAEASRALAGEALLLATQFTTQIRNQTLW